MKLKIISDGTNIGTRLVDEDSGEPIPLIQKLTWEASADGFNLTKVTVEILNIPVEITAKADVELMDYDQANWELKPTKSFEKEIKIISESPKGNGFAPITKICDAQTNEAVGAIQEVKWEAIPDGQKAKVKRIKFDNKDW